MEMSQVTVFENVTLVGKRSTLRRMNHIHSHFNIANEDSLLDDSMLNAFGFPRPAQVMRQLVAAGLKARAFVMRFLPPRSKPFIYVETRHRAYPRGYKPADIGPAQMLASLQDEADVVTK
jgi:hypothetical protein